MKGKSVEKGSRTARDTVLFLVDGQSLLRLSEIYHGHD
jgi:hypothetical protein